MNDRAVSALTDVVAVERIAPGMCQVVTFSDAYTVDARDGGCMCKDSQYNLDAHEHCKHWWAALLADSDDYPELTMTDSLDTPTEPEPETSQPVVADGGSARPEDCSCRPGDSLVCHACHQSGFDQPSGSPATDGGQMQGGNKPEGLDRFTVADTEIETAFHFDTKPEADSKMDKAEEAGANPELSQPGRAPEFLYHAEDERGSDDTDTFDPSEYANASEAINAAPDKDAAERAVAYFESDKDDDLMDGEQPVDADVVDMTEDETEETTPAEVVEEPNDPAPAPDAEPAPDTNHQPEVLSQEEVEQYATDLDDREVGQDPLKWMPGEFVDTIEGSPAINRKGFEVLRFFYGIDLDMEMQVDPEDNDMTHCRFKAVAYTPEGEELEAWGTSHLDRGDDPWLLVEMAATRARKRALAIATGAGAVAVAELKNEPEGN